MTDAPITKLQTLNARGASAIATRGALSDQHVTLANSGVAPGRTVIDSVSGQYVTVLGSSVVYLTPEQIEGATNV